MRKKKMGRDRASQKSGSGRGHRGVRASRTSSTALRAAPEEALAYYEKVRDSRHYRDAVAQAADMADAAAWMARLLRAATPEWLPIEGAPSDGVVVLLCDKNGNRWSAHRERCGRITAVDTRRPTGCRFRPPQ